MQNLKTALTYLTRIPGKAPRKFGLLALFCFALVFRLHHLDHESLWMDELRQTSYYSDSFIQIVADAASQSQPPLDYWVGRLVQYVSDSDSAVRLPSALFGAGAVAVLVVLTAGVSSWPVAFGFGVTYSLLPFNLYYSQEARPYAIAVFLLLCVLWSLNRLLTGGADKKLVRAASLLFFTALFLFSRALFPLVATACLFLILTAWLLVLYKKEKIQLSEKKRLIMLSCAALISAILFYLPSLKIILSKSGSYVADTSIGLNLASFMTAVVKFNLQPIWRAYVVQSEPLTYPLLFLVCISFLIAWYLHVHRHIFIWVITAPLLLLTSCLNLLIFQAKSNMPFRPAYASYMLPLVFILGAVGFQGLWTLAAKTRSAQIFRTLLLVIVSIVFFYTLDAAHQYKSTYRKTDWRTLCGHLASSFDADDVLIFDSLSHYGAWEPTFYGFSRYYRGRSAMLSVAQIPWLAPQMAQIPKNPVFILFQWREYYLTPRSTYPILTFPSADMRIIDYQQLCRDPALVCTELKGFSVITLKQKTGDLARDSYDIIERLISDLPPGSWTTELQLAAAGLARAVNKSHWQDHLKKAEESTRGKNLQKVRNAAKRIAGDAKP